MQCHFYFAPITAIYRTQQEKKNMYKKKKNVYEFNGHVALVSTCGQPKEGLFVKQANLKENRGEKEDHKHLTEGKGVGEITCIVTFRLVFQYNLYLILQDQRSVE